MMKDEHPEQKTEIKTREKICHHANRGYNDEIQIQCYKSVMIMLETDPFARPEIGNFCWIHGRTLEQKPAHVREEESSFYTVRVLHCISFCMMNPVIV